MEGYFLPRLRFTADEAAVLALGGAFARERVDAEPRRAVHEALRKLERVLLQTRRERGIEMVAESQDESFGRAFDFKDADGRLLQAYAGPV